MEFAEFFGKASYVRASTAYQFPYLRKSFFLNKSIRSARLLVSALGFCEIYANGKKITEDLYITPLSEYNRQTPEHIDLYARLDPFFEDELSYTVYVSRFDVTEFLKEGNNAFGVILAGGWYRSGEDKHRNYRNYGDTGVCFKIDVEYADGEKVEIVSDKQTKWKESFLHESGIYHEEHDETKEIQGFSEADFNDEDWGNIALLSAPQANYLWNDCPPNCVIRYIKPKLLKTTPTGKLFDAGENITGYPIILSSTKENTIVCSYSEALNKNGDLDEKHTYGQKSVFFSKGKKEHFIRFTWHGFRYFYIEGVKNDEGFDCKLCAVVHADVKQTAKFHCDSEIVNWIYDAYARTQAENYQCGVPTDCPQIEKKGYTGDGQLLAQAGMTLFDAKALYRKWLRDIADCQDKKTGFVHYTAPCFVGCSGGPGGWSSAIVTVPYFYYKFYGDKEVLKTYYPNMQKYVEFMSSASAADGLVHMDNRKSRCLGDWESPIKPLLPEPFVNTCLYIAALIKLVEISEICERFDEAKRYSAEAEKYRSAVNKAFFEPETGDYCKNEQGANAFALSAGLGDERTEKNLAARYREIKRFDTGIFGTKVLVETLLKAGYADEAYALWDSDDEVSFKSWKNAGATTLWESWKNARSYNHPMFGAFVYCFFEYILGIRQTADGCAYKKIVIQPLRFEKISQASGSVQTESGEISVAFQRDKKETTFEISLPEGVECEFSFNGTKKELVGGKYTFTI